MANPFLKGEKGRKKEKGETDVSIRRSRKGTMMRTRPTAQTRAMHTCKRREIQGRCSGRFGRNGKKRHGTETRGRSKRNVLVQVQNEPTVSKEEEPQGRGEDAAVFELQRQKTSSWTAFGAILATSMGALYFGWLDPNYGYGGKFVDAVEQGLAGGNSQAAVVWLLLIFAMVHSGMAAGRKTAEEWVGPRAYRVAFAVASLPLAVAAVVYFIDHRYDGISLWNVRGVPGVHEMVWAMSFVSFMFLYPSTFNILEVAAVDQPKVHLWETGIIRITRHPQMVGQLIWCVAHTLWIGNSFMVVTSLALMVHHLFGCWHGDRRLEDRYGPAFTAVKDRTSTVPFAAILSGKQKLPEDYYKEFLRGPYFAVFAFTLGAYWAHPLMQAASYKLGW